MNPRVQFFPSPAMDGACPQPLSYIYGHIRRATHCWSATRTSAPAACRWGTRRSSCRPPAPCSCACSSSCECGGGVASSVTGTIRSGQFPLPYLTSYYLTELYIQTEQARAKHTRGCSCCRTDGACNRGQQRGSRETDRWNQWEETEKWVYGLSNLSWYTGTLPSTSGPVY